MAGHHVTGLARSDESAAALAEKGADAHRGDLDDPDSLRAGAAASDGVIHLAFRHDFDDFLGAAATDLRAVQAIGEALAGTDRPFVSTSGTLLLSLLGAGGAGTEQDTLPGGPRIDAENAGDRAGRARGAVVGHPAVADGAQPPGSPRFRLPPDRHRTGDRISAHLGDGSNRWPAVHTLDAAHLYRLALEKAPAGTRLHGVADEGVPFRDIAAVIGRHLDVPVVSIPAEQAGHFGFLALFAALDNPTSNALTRKELDWNPEGPGLLEDLEAGHYFATGERCG